MIMKNRKIEGIHLNATKQLTTISVFVCVPIQNLQSNNKTRINENDTKQKRRGLYVYCFRAILFFQLLTNTTIHFPMVCIKFIVFSVYLLGL